MINCVFQMAVLAETIAFVSYLGVPVNVVTLGAALTGNTSKLWREHTNEGCFPRHYSVWSDDHLLLVLLLLLLGQHAVSSTEDSALFPGLSRFICGVKVSKMFSKFHDEA